MVPSFFPNRFNGFGNQRKIERFGTKRNKPLKRFTDGCATQPQAEAWENEKVSLDNTLRRAGMSVKLSIRHNNYDERHH